MGKTGGSSWLTVVKRAFRSPTKETDKRSSRRRDECEQEEEEKKRGKRRWIFRKPLNQEPVIHGCEARIITSTVANSTAIPDAANLAKSIFPEAVGAEKRRAIAVAVATTAAAQAAVATAQAAMEVVRLTRSSVFIRENHAAVLIQTAFRGYLARRALGALKGLVKLQALVRGNNVRKRAKMTLQCMEALVRVQARVRDHRKRLSHEGSRSSIFGDSNSLWASHLTDRKPNNGDGSSIADDWDEHSHKLQEIKEMLEETKEAALKREIALSYAFSHQIWRTSRKTSEGDNVQEEKPRWRHRASCDQRDPIKVVEMDTTRHFSCSTPNFSRLQNQHHQFQQQGHRSSSYSVSSPLHQAHNKIFLHSSITPPPTKIKHLQVHSASPRCQREQWNQPMPQTPSYMAATASAKARSQSTPRQRDSTPDGEKIGSVKKRLSFPVPEVPHSGYGDGGSTSDYNSRSPSYKSVHGINPGRLEQSSNISSCCTDSLGEEVSPLLASDLRRWLR